MTTGKHANEDPTEQSVDLDDTEETVSVIDLVDDLWDPVEERVAVSAAPFRSERSDKFRKVAAKRRR